uniref:glutamate formimidoyltransferase n=1 Tax=Cannabis sativa TaxID=3483 RepID=A0A803Q6B8_CANSA
MVSAWAMDYLWKYQDANNVVPISMGTTPSNVSNRSTSSDTDMVLAPYARLLEPNVAEAKASLHGLSCCVQMGYTVITAFSDCQRVVLAVNRRGPCPNEFGIVLNDIHHIRNSFSSISLSHCNRSKNYIAHSLAKRALDLDEARCGSRTCPCLNLLIVSSFQAAYCPQADPAFQVPVEKEKIMLKSMLGCCKVYISESRNRAALESIERAAKLFPKAPIINKFVDETYNRVGYTLVSNGSHPRLGIVDHICFHPLLSTSLGQAANIAKSLAADVGYGLQVPTFLYGAAHGEGRTLDTIRRELGYFKPNSSGNQWVGGLKQESLALKPDEGPPHVIPTKGVIVIGATRWVDNYNVPVFSTNLSAIRRIAKGVSGRGGGLPSVQAMALAHGETVIEVACNLLDPNNVGGDRVQLEVERLAKEEGISVGKGYFTDLSQEKIIQNYLKLDSALAEESNSLPLGNIADGCSKSHCKDVITKDCEDKEPTDLGYNYDNENSSSFQQESGAAYLVPKHHQKLHWGYE